MNPNELQKRKADALLELMRQQESWAKRSGIEMERPGYAAKTDGNLFRPLSDGGRRDLDQAQGGELKRRNSNASPPKFHALHSSSALVANVFDYWRSRDLQPLTTALNSPRPLVKMETESTFSTGYGFPCNLDVVLSSAEDELVLAIESKFTEPFGKPKAGLKVGYVPIDGESAWKKRGLDRCDQIARAMQLEPGRFQSLDAAQLLKHLLGLHRKMEGRFRLLYLYYDAEGPAGEIHRAEVEDFSKAIGMEVDFESLTYQAFVTRLASLAAGEEHRPYFAYLADRYRLGG